MKYEVGDTVLLLHSNEEGVIKEILNDNMVVVNVDGIEFPVFIDQIDFPYFKRFSEQSKADRLSKQKNKIYIDQVPREKKFIREEIPEEGILLRLFPVYDDQSYEDNINHYKVYLINTLHESFHFEFNVWYKEGEDFVLTNTIEPQKEFYLNNIAQQELNDIIRFQFLFSPIKPDKNRLPGLAIPFKIKAKVLFRKLEEMHQKNEPSISFTLFETYPENQPEAYYPAPEKKPSFLKPSNLEPPLSIIDLHIEKIPGGEKAKDSYEKLQMQLKYFEKYYRLSVAHLQPKLIVIHGIGSGRLRDEIHEILHHKSEVRFFVNQYHPDFGFGATEIYFKY
ncbi:MAG: Smr/MutS family protein [Chitinophagaceae bacterium]|mgnify:CR=1 FL=1|nr:Smr/MutS family protein [Chitinophagaceae bacterium]